MSLKMSKKVPKMGLKWPKNGPTLLAGPFWAHLGRFWGFFRPFGALGRHFRPNMLPQGSATRIIVPPAVESLAFLASFRAIFGSILGSFCPFGPFWGLLGLF